MYAAGKKLIVLTKAGEHGKVGFAQSCEIMYLIAAGYPFCVIDIGAFLDCLNPFSMGSRMFRDSTKLKELLAEPRPLGCAPWTLIRNVIGKTGLHVAARKAEEVDNLEALDILVQAGFDIDAVDFDGWSPLMDAAAKGCVGAVRRLLSLRADPSLTLRGDGTTALKLATLQSDKHNRTGCKEAAELLRAEVASRSQR